MDTDLVFTILFQVVGGLGVFLLGMKNMSEGLQAVAGDRLRKIIGAITNNRIMAVIVGVLVTCLVQSSSVTTVMVVGFVNSGIMTLMQAIGVIFGANIGTTITGWILVLKIGKYGLPILGVAAFFFLFSKKERLRYIGMTIMGIGMVFFGLELMKNGFKPLRGLPEFSAWFHAFQATSYLGIIKCAAVGCVLTMIVQSSSATLGITIGLASTGVIEFQTAAALVMGENIGTTITAWLASLGTTTTAKRAAYAHVLFNVLGTCWFIALFPIAIKALSALIGARTGYNPLEIGIDDVDETKFGMIITAGIALTHTTFNVTNVVIFLPFAGLLGKFVSKVVPEKAAEEAPQLTYLDVRMLDTPSVGIVQSQRQINLMAESVENMMELLKTCLESEGIHAKEESQIFQREEVLDNVQKEVFLFLSNLVSGQVPHDITHKAHMQMRIADEYESLSDYISNVLKGIIKMRDNEMSLSVEGRTELLGLHELVSNYIQDINEAGRIENEGIIEKAQIDGDLITRQMKDYRRLHLIRLSEKKVPALKSLVYTDQLNAYRRMKDHALNIAEVIAGEK